MTTTTTTTTTTATTTTTTTTTTAAAAAATTTFFQCKDRQGKAKEGRGPRAPTGHSGVGDHPEGDHAVPDFGVAAALAPARVLRGHADPGVVANHYGYVLHPGKSSIAHLIMIGSHPRISMTWTQPGRRAQEGNEKEQALSEGGGTSQKP